MPGMCLGRGIFFRIKRSYFIIIGFKRRTEPLRGLQKSWIRPCHSMRQLMVAIPKDY